MPAGRRLDPVIVTLLDRAGLQPAAVRCAVGLVRHHALREEARERLTHRQVQFADIPHRAREGAGIEKVQHGMFDAADVLIDGQPVGALRRIADRGKAGIVPGAVHERVQRIGLPARRLSAGGAVHVFPGRVMVQRIARLVEGHILRQAHRQHLRRHRHDAADLAINHRDRAAPIALAREAPVAQAVIDRTLTMFRGLEFRDRQALGLVHRKPVEEAGIEDSTRTGIGLVVNAEVFRGGVRRQDNRCHRQRELARKIEVALIVRRAAEDRAAAIARQHEVGGPDGQGAGRIEGMAHAHAQIDAQLGRLLDGLFRCADARGFRDESRNSGILRRDRARQRMVGCERDEAGAEQGVGARRVDFNGICRMVRTALALGLSQESRNLGDVPPDQRAFGLADPVGLHRADLLRPALQFLDFREQIIRIRRDPEEPLRQVALFDQRARTPAAPVDHLLVGEHGIVDRIPVHFRGLAIDEALLEEFQEQRLLRAVVFRIAGREFPAPVQRQAELLELRLHRVDVGIGPFAGIDAALHRGVLCRQAERVPAHRVEDIVALGAPVARDDVAHRIVAHMTHVQPSGRVGEHLEDVSLRRSRRFGGRPGAEQVGCGPGVTPPGLRSLRIISGCHPALPSRHQK